MFLYGDQWPFFHSNWNISIIRGHVFASFHGVQFSSAPRHLHLLINHGYANGTLSLVCSFKYSLLKPYFHLPTCYLYHNLCEMWMCCARAVYVRHANTTSFSCQGQLTVYKCWCFIQIWPSSPKSSPSHLVILVMMMAERWSVDRVVSILVA